MLPPVELPPGGVTTRSYAAKLVVRMSGEIDLCFQPQLAALAQRITAYDGCVVVDLAGLTFGDGTVAAFLAETLSRGAVTVHAPTRLGRELLSLYGLTGLSARRKARGLPGADNSRAR
jgi:hypothetical protein